MASVGEGGRGSFRRVAASLAALLSLSGCASVRGGCDERVEAGPYQLCIRVLQRGTRSEGRVGRLYRQGVEVPGRTVGETIEVNTPTGPVRFVFLGDDRPHLWSRSGWSDRP